MGERETRTQGVPVAEGSWHDRGRRIRAVQSVLAAEASIFSILTVRRGA